MQFCAEGIAGTQGSIQYWRVAILKCGRRSYRAIPALVMRRRLAATADVTVQVPCKTHGGYAEWCNIMRRSSEAAGYSVVQCRDGFAVRVLKAAAAEAAADVA